MLSIYKTADEGLVALDAPEKGCWVNLVAPTPGEVERVAGELAIEPDFISAALDEEESARIDSDSGQLLVVVDMPTVEEENGAYVYATLPLGIVLTEDAIVTVCLREMPLIAEFATGKVRGFWTYKKTRFVLQLLYRNAIRFLAYLRQIERSSLRFEKEMYKSMRNKEMIQLLMIEKSLVYFSTSLKANEVVLEKLMRQELVKRYPDDEDLLEDAIIENKQAIEMCNIYSNVLSATMEAFGSMISNNLNIVMKVLTSITLVISIPTLLASLWGMNVGGIPLSGNPYGFWVMCGVALAMSAVAIVALMRHRMF